MAFGIQMLLALVIAIASITPSVSSEFIRDAAKAVQKPSKDTAVLSEDFVYLSAIVDNTGKTVYDRWVPSRAERIAAEKLYLDPNTRSVLKQATSGKTDLWSGLLDGIPLTNDGTVQQYATKGSQERNADYIDLGRNLSWSNSQNILGGTPLAINAVVELVVVFDKEFGDIFGHNRQSILDYLTVYMWDVNMRYTTLTRDSVRFRINGVVVIATPAAQPFIENSRGSDGRVEFGRILNLDEYRYPKWVFDQMPSWPKFDLAPLMTNAAVEWGGGLAYMNAACWVDNGNRRHIGVSVWNDNGGWGSLVVGAHELGHNLGAPHDEDSNFPGGCTERGFIMGGGSDDLQYMFSSCSDRTISTFVNSDGAACLRNIEGDPILDPEFSSPQSPSMEEQCKRQLNDRTAWIDWSVGGTTCKLMRCLITEGNIIWIHWRRPVDNSPCESGNNRCFRGRCRPQGYLIRNVGSGLCARATSPYEFTAPFDMQPCPRTGTPLDRFVMDSDSTGSRLMTPFTKGAENGDKCAYTGNRDGDIVSTDRCGDGSNPWHRWDMKDVGNGQFQLSHRVSGRCAKPSSRNVGSLVQTFACNPNDVDMKWTRYF